METGVPPILTRLLEYGALFGLLAGVPLLVLTLARTRRGSGPVAVLALILTLAYAWWREMNLPPPAPPAAPPPVILKKKGPVAVPEPPPPPPEPEPESPPPPELEKPKQVKKCGHEVIYSKLDGYSRRLEVKVCGADEKAARETVIAEAFAHAQRGARREDYLGFKARWRGTIAEAVSDAVKAEKPENTPRGTVLSAYVAVDDVARQLRALGFAERNVRPGFRIANEQAITVISMPELEKVILDSLRKQSNFTLSGGIFADPRLLKDELRNLNVVHRQVRYILDVTDMLDVGGDGDTQEYLYVLNVKLGASD